MTKNEALTLALEALESCDCGDYSTGHVIYPSFNVDAVNKAIDAIDDVLAQPWEKFCDSNCVWTDHHPDCTLAQPEPVKISHKHEWFRTGEMKIGQMRCISCGTWGQEETPQPEQKPVAFEVAIAVLDHCYGYGAVSDDMVESTAKVVSAAIAAHGIKGNT